MKKTIIIFWLIFIASAVFSQPDSLWNFNYHRIVAELKSLEDSIPGLAEKLNTSVSDISLSEFLRAVAKSAGMNISVDPGINFQITNNFKDAKVADVLLYLSRQYKLDMSSIGNIIVVGQAKEKPILPVCIMSYDSLSDIFSIEVSDEDIYSMAKKVTAYTGRNVIPASELSGQKVNGFIRNMPFTGAMDKLAYANNLIFKVTDDGYYILEKKTQEKPELVNARSSQPAPATKQEVLKEGTFKLTSKLLGPDSIWLYAEKAPIGEIIREISARTGNNFLMTSIPNGEMDLQLNGSHYDEIMNSIMYGSDHVFRKQNGIYVIGSKKNSELMTQRIIELQFRAVDSIQNYLPNDLTTGIETRVLKEHNSIMLSGPADRINAAELFIRKIDKLVPVISIEVLIIDYNTSFNISTGVSAGVGNNAPEPTSGAVYPSVDISLNSQSINDLISRFNGFGWARIGKVTPNFYASIRAMENQGILNIRSTPILSTLNGHQTELVIGNTEYYLEEMTNIIGTQNPQTATIQTYKPVDAKLAVTITPVVSGDDQITLTIEVVQSDFTERLSNTAPPGLVSRTFKSLIRVKNEEMILLGGLEESRNRSTSHGLPFLSRVPVLKWIFSSRNDEKSKSKLNIFIKPTIIS